jgi:hypothetical protein
MPGEDFADSPVRLRLLGDDVVEARSGGRTEEVDLKREPPRPAEEEEEGELVRTTNPRPTVGARLMRGEETVAAHGGERISLGRVGVEELSSWIEDQDAADKLVVDVPADRLTADQVRHLAAVGSRHRLAIDVNLRGDD